jgi:hypothetical protein
MNASIFAEWLRRQGHRVVHTESSYWFDASNHVYQAFPYHWIINPREKELSDLLRSNQALALRYSTSIDNSFGMVSYHAVYEQPTYRIEDLDRRSRQNIRNGLQNCKVEGISLERLAEEGWTLELDTTERQGRKGALNKESWRKRYLAAVDLPGFEAWGAMVEGRLVASLLSFQMDDCCELISQQCQHEYLSARVNNALTFVVTQEMVQRSGINSIFYALHSLDAPPTVDEYKFRMGYHPKPVRQRVVFHPLFQSLARPSTHAFLVWLRQRKIRSNLLAKSEGMLRFYLQGNKPLPQQEWPPCLETYRNDLVVAQPA